MIVGVKYALHVMHLGTSNINTLSMNTQEKKLRILMLLFTFYSSSTKRICYGLNDIQNNKLTAFFYVCSAPPPPLQAGTFSRGVVTMRCDISTCSSAHISLLVSGSAQTCFDDQVTWSNL